MTIRSPATRGAHVLLLRVVAVHDERLARRVGRRDRDHPARARLEHAGRQREAVRGRREQALLLEHDRDHVELDVGRRQVAARAREAAVLADVGGQRALALHPLGEVGVVERVLERGLLLAEVRHARGRVVLQVHADLGRLGDELDLQQLELLRAARSPTASAAAASCRRRRTRSPRARPATSSVSPPRIAATPAARPPANEHLEHLRVRLDRQVRAVEHRVQVGDRACSRGGRRAGSPGSSRSRPARRR